MRHINMYKEYHVTYVKIKDDYSKIDVIHATMGEGELWNLLGDPLVLHLTLTPDTKYYREEER